MPNVHARRTCTHVERARTSNVHAHMHVERARAWRRFSVSDPSREGGALLTASLTSQRAALHMRGGASCSTQRSAHATCGPNAITCPSAAPPPLRCGRGLSAAARDVPNRRCAHGRQPAPTALDQSGTILRPRGLRPGACPRVDGTLPVPPRSRCRSCAPTRPGCAASTDTGIRTTHPQIASAACARGPVPPAHAVRARPMQACSLRPCKAGCGLCGKHSQPPATASASCSSLCSRCVDVLSAGCAGPLDLLRVCRGLSAGVCRQYYKNYCTEN